MSDATFELHKWHSNHPQLEDNPQSALREDSAQPASSEDQTYVKQQLLVKTSESKLLGVKWDKFQDTIAVQFPSTSGAPTKREVLAKLAKVYDLLGLASPTTLQANLSRSVRLQSTMGRRHPRKPSNTLAEMGAITFGGSNHKKTLSTSPATSYLG